MSISVLLAGAAGVVGAAGAVDFSTAYAQRSSQRSGKENRLRRRVLKIVKRVGAQLGLPAPSDLNSRLVAAGVDLCLADAMAIKVGAATIVALGLLPCALSLTPRLAVLVFTVGPCTAFLALDIWLYKRTQLRCARLERELPDVLQLLRVALGAGMNLTAALAEVGARHPGILAAELRGATNRIQLGEPHRSAFHTLQQRCLIPGVAVMVATLERADRHGIAVSDTLAAQVKQARADQARQAAEAAARAGPKIQLIAALLLVPSVLLLIAAALLPTLAGM